MRGILPYRIGEINFFGSGNDKRNYKSGGVEHVTNDGSALLDIIISFSILCHYVDG
jgi:hypothetical protein